MRSRIDQDTEQKGEFMNRRPFQRFTLPLLTILITTLITATAGAQSSTATIRGKVVSDRGASISGAEVNAVGTATGFVHTVITAADGSYTLGGLTPGTYNLIVAAPGFEPKTETLTVRVGQSVDMDLRLTNTAVLAESITVVGNQVIDTRTPEAATNVTPQEIEALPQNDRNFLNFAQLAPGIRLSNDPLRKTIAGDAQPAENTNVFIDGVSFKNDVIAGGMVGQDSTRGNPFPQNAVQEFRVITQNYSAQYDKASSAIITAVTKSGGNKLDGQLFAFYQPKRWVAATPLNFGYSTLATNQTYHRTQDGISLGGPIVKDAFNFFLSYEGDDEHATTAVNVGNPNFANQFAQYAGVFASPFKSNLAFGKLSWQPLKNQLVDVSGNYRHENEVRSFGGTTSYQSAENIKNSVTGATVRDQWNSNNSLNQASLSLQNFAWNPSSLQPGTVGLNYEGVIRIGGRSTTQDIKQRRLELRDDFNFSGMKWHGDHGLQIGGNFDDMKYTFNKLQNANPEYTFRQVGGVFTSPFQAVYGFGNPLISSKNHEFGVYGQDNWTISRNLNLNLGLRWDYESNGIDAGYVTPAAIRTGLAGKVDPSYFSTGTERKQFKGAIQPRLGFAYDVMGDSRSVIFGGAGRYYDRTFFNATLDERFRLQFPTYNIQFSPDGSNGTIMWDPKYLTAAGLDALINDNTVPADKRPHPEIYLLNNNTKPPYANQFNLGYRQGLGRWLGSISYNGVRGYRGLTWLSATGLCCSALVPGFGNVIISDPVGKRTWYDGLYLTFDRPYTTQTRWGARFAWTHARAQQNGNDLFSLDYPSAAMYPRRDVPNSERDRIVASGVIGLPFEIRFSTIVSLGSGGATPVLDFSQGFSLQNRLATQPFKRQIYPKRTWGFADRSIDLRAEKTFHAFGPTSLGLVAEGFNVANFHNYGCLDQHNFLPPEGNPSLGQAGCVINLGRRFQAGVRVNF